MRYMLDLFSGLGGASKAFQESDEWEVVTVDNNPEFEPSICADVLDLTPENFEEYDFEVIWASPPCNCFSCVTIGVYWNHFPKPKRRETVKAIELVYHTLWLISKLNPKWWFLENPVGMLRNVIGIPTGTVTYCQYGSDYMKPTDLWGEHPPSFTYKRCRNGDNCHIHSTRNSHTGIKDNKEDSSGRAKIPYGLSKAVLKAVENPEPVNLLKYV